MISGIMTDPFALSYPAALDSANKALQAIICACWPRFANTPWQNEVIKTLVVCWLDFHEDARASQHRDIEAELVKTASMLVAVMRAGNVDVTAVFAPLIVKDLDLGALFGPATAVAS